MSKFVHLHVHSHYSLLDGLGKIPELIDRAKTLDMDAIALTDHGVLYGAIEFYQEAKKAGIKPIIGVETYLAPRALTDKTPKIDASPYHQLLLAKNLAGYKNLLQLVSIAHIQGYYYRPRIDMEALIKYKDGLIATSSCLAGLIPQKLQGRDYEGAKKIASEYAELFGPENFYLELQHHPSLDRQIEVNQGLKKLARDLKLPLIATGDIHYVKPDDKETHEILLAINTGKDLDDKDRMTLSDIDLCLQDADYFQKNFADVPEALSNTVKIADLCNLEIPLNQQLLPHFPLPKGQSAADYLEKLCQNGFKKRYQEISPELKDRLNYELSTINRMGFASYFLIVADFVNWAKNQGILVGPGRGSAAGSIVSYVLNITDLDPLEYGLLFERFLNPDRISMPDIDMDFADDRRAEVIQYVRDKFGDDHVAGVITYGTMMSRAAVRDVGRALGMSYGDVDAIAKIVPPPVQGRHISLKDSIKNNPEVREVYQNDPQAKRLLSLAARIEGTVRHASQHACAIVISKEPLTSYAPLQIAQKGDVGQITQYSMKPIEEIGLLKIDLLGLSNLTIMANAVKIIEAVYGEHVDIHHLPLNDQKTYRLLGLGETTGVFQLESAGMKRYIKELKPTKLSEIAIMVALYRPGPMQWIESFIKRRHGEEQVVYAHPLVKNALKETYGIPIYQEQVMQISKDMAGFSGGEADTLRKAMGKKIAKLMKQMKTKFVDGAIQNGVKKDLAERIFVQLEDFAAYGFNKSHAAAYAMIAYQTAYLKAHFADCFMAALMTSDFQNIDRISLEIEECNRIGIQVLPPDINESFVEFGVVKNEKTIRFGLSAIKNVGVGVAKALVEDRKQHGPFRSLEDFVIRLGGSVINKKVIEALAKAGALDKFGERNQLLAGVEAILRYMTSQEKQVANGQLDLFTVPGNKAQVTKIPLPEIQPASKNQRLAWEKELLGIYLSDHPLKDIEAMLPKISTSISELTEKNIGDTVRLAGIITSVRKIFTRTQEPMLFIRLEDLSGGIEAVIFSRYFEKLNIFCQADNIVIAEGRVNFRDGELKFIAENMEELGHQNSFEDLEKRQQSLLTKRQGRPENIPITKSEPSSIPCLEITLPKHCPQKTLMEIKKILENAPGQMPIYLKIPQNGDYRIIKTRTKINQSSKLILELKTILGKENVNEKSE